MHQAPPPGEDQHRIGHLLCVGHGLLEQRARVEPTCRRWLVLLGATAAHQRDPRWSPQLRKARPVGLDVFEPAEAHRSAPAW